MGGLDGAIPRRGELRARHQLPDPVMHEARYPVGQRTGHIAQTVHQLLHIDVGEDLRQPLQLPPLVLAEPRSDDSAAGAFIRVGHRRLPD